MNGCCCAPAHVSRQHQLWLCTGVKAFSFSPFLWYTTVPYYYFIWKRKERVKIKKENTFRYIDIQLHRMESSCRIRSHGRRTWRRRIESRVKKTTTKCRTVFCQQGLYNFQLQELCYQTFGLPSIPLVRQLDEIVKSFGTDLTGSNRVW